MIAIEIREALEKSYPDVTDLEFSIEHSGSAHEHPLIAIGVLLISSIVLETTAPAKLAEFTRYSERFMRAVARNMEISGLWANDRYDCWSWSRGEHVPQPENREFWDHAEPPAPERSQFRRLRAQVRSEGRIHRPFQSHPRLQGGFDPLSKCS